MLGRGSRDTEGCEPLVVDPGQERPRQVRDPDLLLGERGPWHGRRGREPGGHRAHVMSGLGPHLQVAPVLQELVGSKHRRQAHPLLAAVGAHRGQAVAGAEYPGLDQSDELVGQALVEHPVPAGRAAAADCTGDSSHVLKLLWLQKSA